MKTRSQTTNKIKQFEVNIDFDDAIKEWRSNKKSTKNGCYKYICPVTKNGLKCGKICYNKLAYCWQHRKTL